MPRRLKTIKLKVSKPKWKPVKNVTKKEKAIACLITQPTLPWPLKLISQSTMFDG